MTQVVERAFMQNQIFFGPLFKRNGGFDEEMVWDSRDLGGDGLV